MKKTPPPSNLPMPRKRKLWLKVLRASFWWLCFSRHPTLMFNPRGMRPCAGLKKCSVSPHFCPQPAYHWKVTSSDYILNFKMVSKGRRGLKTFLMFCSHRVIENWFHKDTQTEAEAAATVWDYAYPQKWECCQHMTNVLAAAGKAYQASNVIRYIFAQSHVVPAFKYPGCTLKGWAKYQSFKVSDYYMQNRELLTLVSLTFLSQSWNQEQCNVFLVDRLLFWQSLFFTVQCGYI